MNIQQHHAHSTNETIDHSAVIELEVFRNLLDSVNIGIGLMDSNYTLLYCNSSLNQLLGNSKHGPLGGKVTLNKSLETNKFEEIHQQLEQADFWEGVLPELGTGWQVRISRISFPIPGSVTGLSDAQLILTVADHSNILKQQQELSIAKNIAENSDRAKSEFLSQMSHELRTPLNAVLGFTQLLQTGPALSEEQKDYLNEIMSASEYLLKLISEILSLSKVEHESGELRIVNESINVGDLIAECISLVQPLAQKTNIQIVQSESETSLLVDRIRLKQVLLNLLSNAIKYNRNGGKVVIKSFFIADHKIRIEIQDSGKGIHAQLLNTIFNPFERLGIKDNQVEGTGIGLMITRRLVKMMNGKVSVLSEPGSGSIFSLEFPAGSSSSNEENTQVVEKLQKIVWIGNDSNARQIAERLIELRPAVEFQHTKNITSAIELSSKLTPDLLFLTIEDSLAQLYNPSPETKKLLNYIPTIAVIAARSTLIEQLDMHLVFAAYISMPLNIIDFMEIVDNRLCVT